jgi:hypothetical protein
MRKTWDDKCEELADHFLGDFQLIPHSVAGYKRLRDELASEIQCSIEDWLDNHNDELIKN